ncbi:MAG: calcium-binding protein [bacterium]|nr:calcium-binding protein [bacterium]
MRVRSLAALTCAPLTLALGLALIPASASASPLPAGTVTSVPTGDVSGQLLDHCTINGTAGDDRLVGTNGRDIICGRGGDDVLIGLGGRDILIGGAGNDTLRGGTGADFLDGGQGNDVEDGGPGKDDVGAFPYPDILFEFKLTSELAVGSKIDMKFEIETSNCVTDTSDPQITIDTARQVNRVQLYRHYFAFDSHCLLDKSYGTWIVTVTRPNGSTYGGHLYAEFSGASVSPYMKVECSEWKNFCKGGRSDSEALPQVIIGL